MAVDFYPRNSHPLELHKLVNGNTAPLVEREARDISESDTSLRVVLRDIPSAASRDIEELGNETRVFNFRLRAIRITLHELLDFRDEFCLVHSKKG